MVDVPAKLSARMRMFATGQGRKTDDTDAHSIALAGVRISGLHPVVSDKQREVLRLLVDRRRRIGEEHTVKVCQLHQILLELIPGGAKKDLSAAHPAPRCRRQDPQAGRDGTDRGPGAGLCPQEGRQQGTR
ncbi:IS110 family transposase [Tessaracoccus lapidicaptus]|uniref:IS110 family transposase n=1 Tax=Tessaracoccus lapidicaptus TaxID=1427523 RepID=UPI00333E48AF